MAAVAGILLVQLLPQRPDEVRFHAYYVLALGGLEAFLLGMAMAVSAFRFSAWAHLIAGTGGGALVLFATPRALLGREGELVVFLLGSLSLLVAMTVVTRQYWRGSRFAAMLVAAGGLIGALAFLRAALVRYAQYSQSSSSGIAGIVAWSIELALSFGLGGALAFMGGVLQRRQRLSRPGTGPAL